jgi:hypothetical protein
MSLKQETEKAELELQEFRLKLQKRLKGFEHTAQVKENHILTGVDLETTAPCRTPNHHNKKHQKKDWFLTFLVWI